MKMTFTQYTRLIHITLAIMWPMTATAAVSLIEIWKGYTLGVLGVLILISTLAGLTALILNIDRGLRLTGKFPPFFFIHTLAHLLASWLGGILAVVLSEVTGRDGWTLLLLVLTFSFGGVKVLERIFERIIDKFLPELPQSP